MIIRNYIDDPDKRDANGVTLWEGLAALEMHERSEGRICNANLINRAHNILRAAMPASAQAMETEGGDRRAPGEA